MARHAITHDQDSDEQFFYALLFFNQCKPFDAEKLL